MQAQSTTSMAVDLESIPRIVPQQASHLINTAKVVKGHKLRTQDFIRLQLIRFRYCSPIKYQDQIEQNLLSLSKTTEFAEKYQPFQNQQNKNQLHNLIVQQRQKKSKEVANQIKLFSTQNHFNLSKQTNKANFTIKVKPATSQQHRKIYRKDQNKLLSLNKTQNILRPPLPLNNKVQFFSQNLGKKMNDYMNQMIIPHMQNEEEQPNKQPPDHFKQKQSQFQKYMSKDRKVPQTSYIKHMKKKLKNKYQNSISSNNSLIKPKYTLKDFALLDSKDATKALDQQTFYSIQASNNPNQSYSSSNNKRILSKSGTAEKVLPYNHSANQQRWNKV